jgi:2-hydroxy-6-oxonona-2,4-dienedioate hydrolase/2-hydroxy-6-oxo-6-(2'-carboxyphenyl)-hexa-2,4-dienoate hydrolase
MPAASAKLPFALSREVRERPASDWASVADELSVAKVRIVEGRRWKHRVFEAGSGQPLLMYHGIGGHAETYARNIRALSEHFHVYAVDALFHGRSSKDGFDLPTMYDLLVDGFVDLVDALGYRSVAFEGESMGAMFGANLALRYPERVDRMVLTAGFYLFKPARAGFATAAHAARNLGELSTKAVVEPTFENVQRRMRWLVAEPGRMTDDIVDVRRELYADPEINASMRRVFNLDHGQFSTDLYDWPYTESDLASWQPETLVLWGEHNPGQGPDFGVYCADLIGAQFYTVADSGHWPQWEHPDEYNQLLIEYLTA